MASLVPPNLHVSTAWLVPPHLHVSTALLVSTHLHVSTALLVPPHLHVSTASLVLAHLHVSTASLVPPHRHVSTALLVLAHLHVSTSSLVPPHLHVSSALYCRKPRLKLLACRPENSKTGLTKQIEKSKTCSKRNAPATIICLQNLMIKLPRLHIRLPAVDSRLRLGPCRMIGGQDLLRGHNGMLIWVTCAPSTRPWRRLRTLTSDPIPSTLFGWKNPADRQGSHPPALVRAFRGPLQWPTHSAGVFTSQDSPRGLEAGAG